MSVAPCIHLTFLLRQRGQPICFTSSGPLGAAILKRVLQSRHRNSQRGGPIIGLWSEFLSMSFDLQRGQAKLAAELTPCTLNISPQLEHRKSFSRQAYIANHLPNALFNVYCKTNCLTGLASAEAPLDSAGAAAATPVGGFSSEPG